MSDHPAGQPRGGLLKWALWGVALVGVAAVLYIMAKASSKPEPARPSAQAPAAASATLKSVMDKFEPVEGPAPDYAFKDAEGRPAKVADFKGKVVVVNLWATWCGPCKVEMPMLAKLAADYQGQPVEVVTVSIDKDADVEQARAFIASHAPLKFYSDPEAKMPWAVSPAIKGMPTTFIIGKAGNERGRVSGEADWAGPGAKAIINRVLAEG